MAVEAADNALVTLDEVKDWLALSEAGVDDFLQRAINDWSDAIETRCGRVFRSVEYEGEIHAGGRKAILLKNIPVTAITSITVDDGALGSDDYTYDGPSGIVRLVSGKAFGGGPGSVEVDYTGGYAALPGDLKRGAKQLVALDYYLSGRGRKALAKSAESIGDGSVSYNRGPNDQEKIMQTILRIYGRR